jgi:hypothetical protein
VAVVIALFCVGHHLRSRCGGCVVLVVVVATDALVYSILRGGIGLRGKLKKRWTRSGHH